MASKPRVFIRDATGLVREFGSWDSFAFNFGGIVTVVGLSALFVSFNVLTGANLLVVLLLILPILIAYYVADTQLGIAMPRSGGDSRLRKPYFASSNRFSGERRVSVLTNTKSGDFLRTNRHWLRAWDY